MNGMKATTLGEFIQEEMARLNVGLREFAKLTNVPHPTLSRIIDEKENYYPTIQTLIRLAQGTSTDIRTLAAIVAPEAVIGQNTNALVLAERISRLSESQQELVDAFIAGKSFKYGNK